MKKIILICTFLVSIAGYVNADILDDISAIKTMKADFIQVNSIKDFGEDIYKGEVVIQAKKATLWDYTEPSKSWYLITADGMQQYDSASNQLLKFSKENIGSNALIEILMDFDSIKKSFDIVINGNTARLKPKTDSDIVYLDISVDNGTVKRMTILDKAENKSEITFSGIVLNKPVDEKTFTKTVPKGTEVFEVNK